MHTSARTVAILPEVDADTTVEINPAPICVLTTYRASGAGWIGTLTKPILRCVLPTFHCGAVAVGGVERSQRIRNKASKQRCWHFVWKMRAMRRADAATSNAYRDLVSSGDTFWCIRTYNYPQDG